VTAAIKLNTTLASWKTNIQEYVDIYRAGQSEKKRGSQDLVQDPSIPVS